MIREDRIQLNDRFIQVFNLLQERGDVVLNDRSGKGMGDFAERILGNRAYGHIVRAFLNEDDKRVIDYRHARTICREFGVNESYLIDGIGTPFGIELPQMDRANTVYPQGNILFTSVQAFAGSGEAAGGQSAEDNQYFAVPGIAGSGLVAFPIEGDSMNPIISNGDTIICREVRSLDEIKDNEIYTVKINGSLWVKHVQKMYNNRGKINKLKLISANHLEFDAFEEDVNETTKLYKVISIIHNL